MTLQEQVCTLQQAQRLKGLGCEQGCQHFWVQIEQEWFVLPRLLWENKFDKTEYYRAYTVAELGVMLYKFTDTMPQYVSMSIKDFIDVAYWWHDDLFTIIGLTKREVIPFPTEAQARAALLIHMLEKEKEHGN